MKTPLKLVFGAFVAFLIVQNASAMPLFSVGDTAVSYTSDALRADGAQANVDILSRDASKKYLLIDLFYLACGPCRVNMKTLSTFVPMHPNLAVKYLTGHDTVQDLRNYFDQNPGYLQGDVLADLWRKQPGVARPLPYIPEYVPTSYLIGPDQKVLWVSVGSFSEADLAEIEAIIGSSR
jgi:hypothetical protein